MGPRIIGLIDVEGVLDGLRSVRVVLELCEGGQLYDRIQDKGHYDEPEGRIVVRQILEAVEFMHSRGVMHRDLKPENVLLISPESDVDIKVCDMGIAKLAGKDNFGKRGVPRSCSFKGSDFYLAPEMIWQEEYGTEIDIWAVGVM